MRPRGVILRAARKAYFEYKKILEEKERERAKQVSQQELRWCLIVFGCIVVIIIFCSITFPAHE